MRNIRKLILVVFALLWATLSFASHTVKVYEMNGQVHAQVFLDENKVEKILIRALPNSADRTPKGAVLRINGVTVAAWKAPAYEFEFNLDSDSLPALTGDLPIPWLKGDPDQKLDLRRFRVGMNLAEFYFVTADDRGRLDRNKTAAASLQFTIEDDPAPTAATTAGGQQMTPGQLDAAIKAAYQQGANDAAKASTGDSSKLEGQIKQLLDENNRLRAQLGSNSAPTTPTVSSGTNSACQVFGVAFTPTGDMLRGYTREHFEMLARRAMDRGPLDLTHPCRVRQGQSFMLFVRSGSGFVMTVFNGDDVNDYQGCKVDGHFQYGRVLSFPQGITRTHVTIDGRVVAFETAGGMAR